MSRPKAPALDLAHIDRHVVVDDGEIRRLAALLHQSARVRAGAAAHVARPNERAADDEDQPVVELDPEVLNRYAVGSRPLPVPAD